MQEQQKKKKAQAIAKRKVTRSSSLSSEASEKSSSDSDTEQSSHPAVSGSAESSGDSESDNEVTLKKPTKVSPKDAKANKSSLPKKVRVEDTKKSKLAHAKKSGNRDPLSSEDDSIALSSTAVSSAAVSPNKNSNTSKKAMNGGRPNTRQRGGTNMRRSRHVTGKNHSALIDTDSDMEMTSTANESVGSSPRKKSGRGRLQKKKTSEKTKTSSFSGDDSQGEEVPRRKSSSTKDRTSIGQDSSISATTITERLLASRNLERQTSSPSGEGFGSSNPTHVPSAGNHATGPTHSVVALPPVRRTFEGCTPIEDRKCPTTGCDSTGNLSGSNKFDRHFTQDACPLYHNMVKKECRDFRSEINKKHSSRRKASSVMAGARSPLGSPSAEQKRHAQMVSDLYIYIHTHIYILVHK